jgi:hypothetical protein
LHPTKLRIGIVLDNFSPHLSTKPTNASLSGRQRTTSNSLTRTYSSSLNRTEAQFEALRYFALDDADHASHRDQASTIHRYIIWRNATPTTAPYVNL